MTVVLEGGRKAVFRQCALDPCIFQLCPLEGDGIYGAPVAYIGVHVDDILMIGDGKVNEVLRKVLSSAFPVDEWEQDNFEYIGSLIQVFQDYVSVTQENYAETRIFEVEIYTGQYDDELASDEQRADNKSLIGALSWLAGQTRPGLQTGVSMAQQLQKELTVADVKFSNGLSRRAAQHKGRGVILRPIDLQRAVVLAYHDAGWANAPQPPDDPFYNLSHDDEIGGRINDGPFAKKSRPTKRGNSRIASQIGAIFLLADREILHGKGTKTSLWIGGARLVQEYVDPLLLRRRWPVQLPWRTPSISRSSSKAY